jgi:hypothetical protein
MAAVAGVVALVPVAAVTLPAGAATSGSSSATLTLTPPPVRSVTVTPATATFANCSGPNANLLAFPNGTCSVGTFVAGPVTGGITVTNGAAAGHIYVNGANAVPADAGTPWTLTSAIAPGTDSYLEETGAYSNSINAPVHQVLTNTAACDVAFTPAFAVGGGCAATAGQVGNEQLAITGPSTSSDSGPFTITTTWTAVP